MEAIAQPNPRHLSPRALAQGADTGKSRTATRVGGGAVAQAASHSPRECRGHSSNLRQPAIKVPDGVAAAAGIHIHSLIVRLQVVSRELNDAKRKLDELCTAIGETG